MFVGQLERKKEVNPAFFYDFMVNEEGRLIRVFWADATCRKNYSLFGDVLSVDATYTTNQYDMKFVPFSRVNHHLQSIFLGAASMADEKIDTKLELPWRLDICLAAKMKPPRYIAFFGGARKPPSKCNYMAAFVNSQGNANIPWRFRNAAKKNADFLGCFVELPS
jgi:hypothetical protein